MTLDELKEGGLNQEASRREQVLFALVMLAIVAAFFRVVYTSNSVRLDTLGARVVSLKMESDVLRKFQESTPVVVRSSTQTRDVKVRVLYGDIRSEITEASHLLPQLTEPYLLSNLVMKGLHFLSTVHEPGYTVTEFILMTEGKFSDTVLYLQKLEQFPALFDIKDVSYKLNEEGATVQGEVNGRFYHLDDPGGGS